MAKYTLTDISGNGEKMTVQRISGGAVEIRLGDRTIRCLTEDLAAMIRSELPEDRAAELFSEIEDRAIRRGKARVRVIAQKDLKKGDEVIFTIDVNKYLDKNGNPTGVRATDWGFIY